MNIDTRLLGALQAAIFPADRPTMLVCPEIARENALHIKALLPRVHMYFAYKAFSDARIIAELKDVVDGFDIASSGELKELLDLGIDPHTIWMSNPVKIRSDIEYAYSRGVEGYTAQSSDELKKIAECAPGSKVLIRFHIESEDDQMAEKFTRKFGADRGDVLSLLQFAEKQGLDPIGITFSIGSQMENPYLWNRAIKTASELLASARQAGISLSVLNIGGGLPVSYSDTRTQGIAIDKIRSALDEYISEDITVVAEPGRALVANTASHVSNVIGCELRAGINWLYLDMGIFSGLFESKEYGRLLQPVYKLCSMDDDQLTEYILAGPSCDGEDVIGRCFLPKDMKMGDQILFGLSGAYTQSYMTNFNRLPVPEIQYVS